MFLVRETFILNFTIVIIFLRERIKYSAKQNTLTYRKNFWRNHDRFNVFNLEKRKSFTKRFLCYFRSISSDWTTLAASLLWFPTSIIFL